MRRRDRAEIMAAILSLCKRPQNKTGIMRKTNLTWKLAHQYLEELQARTLLKCHHSRIRYETTQKGADFLRKWEKCAELLDTRR